MKWNIGKHNRIAPTALLALASFALLAGCGLNEVREAIDGRYHKLSAGNGVYLTIKRIATSCMIYSYDICRSTGKSLQVCGQETLKVSREAIERSLKSPAKELWNGQGLVYGLHPNIGRGFRDEEAVDFATAIKDLRSRNHECLRMHWKPTGTNWTTMDESAAECSHGDPVFYQGEIINCPAP